MFNTPGSRAGRKRPVAAVATPNVGAPTIVVKAADETVTSSTALQNDDHLLFPVGASETWVYEFILFYTAATTGDLKVALTAPVGSTIRWTTNGLAGSAATNADSLASNVGTTSGTASGYHGGAGATEISIIIKGYVTTAATPGNVTLQWAQNSSSGTDTIIKTGSYLKADKV